MTVKKIVVRLAAEGGKVVKSEMESIGTSGEASFAKLGGAAQMVSARLAAILSPANVAMAAVAALGSAMFAASRGAEDIDRIAKAATRLGSSSLGIRTAELATSEMGIAFDVVADAAQVMAREVLKGSRGAGDAMARLGLTAKDLTEGDIDQRLARVADAIEEMGLSSAEASVLVQQLGIRNLDAVAAVINGGEAFRNARKDILDYGLSISALDTKRIEEANDRIGRLGLISTYLGQQMSLALTPALGALAKGFTDSLREGGLLRMAIDALVAPFRVVANVVESVVVIGRSFIDWIVQGVQQTELLRSTFDGMASTLGTLASVLTAQLQWAYDVVVSFRDLIRGAGGFGEAMGLVADVGTDVWKRINYGASALGSAIGSVAAGIKGVFAEAFAYILRTFARVTQAVADGVNGLFSKMGIEVNAVGMGAEAADAMGDAATDAWNRMRLLGERSSAIFADIGKPLESVNALAAAMARGRGETEEAQKAVVALGEALTSTGGAGGAARKAIEESLTGWDAVRDRLADFYKKGADGGKQMGDIITKAFGGAEDALAKFVTGGKVDFSALTNSILTDLVKLTTRATIFGPLAKILETSFKGLTGPVLHTGGIVGAGGVSRTIPAAALMGAQRFHNGGYPGLGPNEVPAILERGERVLSRREVAAGMGMGGGGPRTVVQVVNNSGQPVRETREPGPDGSELIRIEVGKQMAQGGFDKAQRARFGAQPTVVRR